MVEPITDFLLGSWTRSFIRITLTTLPPGIGTRQARGIEAEVGIVVEAI